MRILLLSFLLCLSIPSFGIQKQHLSQLDSVLEHRAEIASMRDQELENAKAKISGTRNEAEKLIRLISMAQEYSTFQFDSALVYTQRSLALSRRLGKGAEESHARIIYVELLATGGYYSQAEAEYLQIDTTLVADDWKYRYHMAGFWLYNYWADYVQGTGFSPRFAQKKLQSAQRARQTVAPADARYHYLCGEIAYMTHGATDAAIASYLKALGMCRQRSRLYAAGAYALARCYKDKGQDDDYGRWLTQAALADQLTPLKENYALQEIAMNIFDEGRGDVKRASFYINCSMEDAKFYGDKLRMLEISQKLPVIVSAYQQHIGRQRTWLLRASIVSSILMILFLASLLMVRRQNRKLHDRRIEIERKNQLLEEMNTALGEANSRLTALNERLEYTHQVRESYLRLFMDLSALAVERINNYRMVVKRKIKAGQTADLLKTVSSDSIATTEQTAFLQRFDKAFLELYPDFLIQLNTLLQADSQIAMDRSGGFTTEIRICALIRLGVTESAEIATLLAYSPQTIYNKRSSLKQKALHRDTFDEDVAGLCKTI